MSWKYPVATMMDWKMDILDTGMVVEEEEVHIDMEHMAQHMDTVMEHMETGIAVLCVSGARAV